MPDGDAAAPAASPAPAQGTVGRANAFRLADLEKDQPDACGAMVERVLWNTDDYIVYIADAEIKVQFSDNPATQKEQRTALFQMGEGIAKFNHLLLTMHSRNLEKFVGWLKFWDRNSDEVKEREKKKHYETEMGRCMAQALSGDTTGAKKAMKRLLALIAARVSNRGRVVHLLVNVVLVLFAILAGLAYVYFDPNTTLGFNQKEMATAIMMGCVGALFSTTVGLQSMQVDPTVSMGMHITYAFQRVLVGALGAVVLYFGFRSGIVSGLFQPVEGSVFNAISAAIGGSQPFDPYWLSFVCILAGFSERLVPNLLDSKAEQAMAQASSDAGTAGDGGS